MYNRKSGTCTNVTILYYALLTIVLLLGGREILYKGRIVGHPKQLSKGSFHYIVKDSKGDIFLKFELLLSTP